MDTQLLIHAGAQKITRQDLTLVPTPPATDTHKPIPHHTLIDALEEALAFRHIKVEYDEYAVSPNGTRLFGCLALSTTYEAVRFAIGIRNSHDKSMRLGMVAGYRVFVCDNMAFAGDFKSMLAKHTKHFDLMDALSVGVDRIQRNWQPLREAIDRKRTRHLTEDEARALIYRAFLEERFPVKLMKRIHHEIFVAPNYNKFQQPTVWGLENAFTTAFKELAPVRQYEMTAKLGKFLQPYAVTA